MELAGDRLRGARGRRVIRLLQESKQALSRAPPLPALARGNYRNLRRCPPCGRARSRACFVFRFQEGSRLVAAHTVFQSPARGLPGAWLP